MFGVSTRCRLSTGWYHPFAIDPTPAVRSRRNVALSQASPVSGIAWLCTLGRCSILSSRRVPRWQHPQRTTQRHCWFLSVVSIDPTRCVGQWWIGRKAVGPTFGIVSVVDRTGLDARRPSGIGKSLWGTPETTPTTRPRRAVIHRDVRRAEGDRTIGGESVVTAGVGGRPQRESGRGQVQLRREARLLGATRVPTGIGSPANLHGATATVGRIHYCGRVHVALRDRFTQPYHTTKPAALVVPGSQSRQQVMRVDTSICGRGRAIQ